MATDETLVPPHPAPALGLMAGTGAAGRAGAVGRRLRAGGAARQADGPGDRRLLAGADGLQPADAAHRGRRGRLLQPLQPLWASTPTATSSPTLAAEMPTVENGGISADGLNWKVKLRDDVKWHDGSRSRAEDVKFTIELINNPDFRAGGAPGTSWCATSRWSARPRSPGGWRSRYAPYPAILAWTFIVPKHSSRQGSRSEHRALQQRADRHGPVQVGRARRRATTSRWRPTPTTTARGRTSSA